MSGHCPFRELLPGAQLHPQEWPLARDMVKLQFTTLFAVGWLFSEGLMGRRGATTYGPCRFLEPRPGPKSIHLAWLQLADTFTARSMIKCAIGWWSSVAMGVRGDKTMFGHYPYPGHPVGAN